MLKELSRHVLADGFVHSANPLNLRPGCMGKGSKNVIFLGNGRSSIYRGPLVQGGVAGGRVMFSLSDGGYASLGDGANTGIGSVVNLIARAFMYIGTGPLYINGATRSVSATTTPQIILYRAGSFSGANTGPYAMGIDRPSAPTIATTGSSSTTNVGTTSAVIWWVRSTTGGRSRKSAPSNVLTVNGNVVRLSITTAAKTAAEALGIDRIGIGVTQWGYGSTGPHYELTEVALSSLVDDGAGNHYKDLQWASAELAGADLAPLDDFQPPPGVFACAIEDAVAIIGCYGDSTSGATATSPGTAIAVSLPVLIESFPPDNLLFLPEAPVGVLPHPSDGLCFIGCKNSLHALTYTGGNPPMSLQSVWATTGIATQQNMFLGDGGRLYAFSNGKRGLVRVGEGNEPEVEWAADVSEYVSSWTAADVIGGWDNDHQSAIFGHNKELLAFHTPTGRWSAPLDLSGVVGANEKLCASVTVQGSLLLATRDTVTTSNPIKLYAFNAGTGTLAEVYFPWTASSNVSDTVTQLSVVLRSDNTSNAVTMKIFSNGDDASPVTTKTYTPTRTGIVHLPVQKINVRNAKSHAVYVSRQSSGSVDAGVDVVSTSGESSGVAI